MKNIRLLLLMLCCSASLLQAQPAYIDLTTGTSAFGTTDPNWEVKKPGATNFNAAFVVERLNGYANNGCGKWISHGIIYGTFPTIQPGKSSSGVFTYRYFFDYNPNECAFQADLNLSFIAADNEVDGIKINGNSIPVNSGIDFNPGESINEDISQYVTFGTNMVEILVYNINSYQALQVCGGITITPIPPVTTTTTTVEISTGLTGAGAPGWEVKVPGSSNFVTPTILDDATLPGSFRANYVLPQDPCGHWITDRWLQAESSPGEFVFRLQFEVEGCDVTSAILNAPFISADNWFKAFKINGNALTVPNPYTTFTGSTSYTNEVVTSFITTGTNTIEITVENQPNVDTYLAFIMCGNILIETTCPNCTPIIPVDLQCYGGIAPIGGGPPSYMLDWCDVAGSTGYDVEIVYNDPSCCGPGGAPYGSYFELSNTLSFLLLDTYEPCFSWRVRSRCENGLYGPWSDYSCSCNNPSPFFPKKDVSSDIAANTKSISVSPNPSSGLYNVDYMLTGKVDYTVTTITGRVVLNNTANNINSLQINLADQPNGIYLLKVQSADKTEVVKLVKQN